MSNNPLTPEKKEIMHRVSLAEAVEKMNQLPKPTKKSHHINVVVKDLDTGEIVNMECMPFGKTWIPACFNKYQ